MVGIPTEVNSNPACQSPFDPIRFLQLSALNFQPFLNTTMDDGDHFQQILAWTLKSRWQKQNQLLREITASFRSEK